jgi:hypothetical protein
VRIRGNSWQERLRDAWRVLTGAISVKVDDSPGWAVLMRDVGPHDRPWSETYEDLKDAVDAWRKNFLVRRIVALIRSYVVGPGIKITSRKAQVDRFIDQFWNHPQNRMDRRLGPLCDEFTRAGELFVAFHTNPADGMSYLRTIPATQIHTIETAPDDYETELRYAETGPTLEPKWWLSPNAPAASLPDESGRLPPILAHFAVNRPVGATRGESDLTPILPWAKRYTEWLKDRVHLNRIRTRQAMLDVQIADDSQVEAKRRQIETSNPLEHGTYIHGPGETLTVHPLEIKADDVKEDGKALRLAIAAGSGLALHYMAEGESVNYATAKEMGEPTARFLSDRQQEFCDILIDIISIAYWRYQLTRGTPGGWTPTLGRDLALSAVTAEVAREDNANLATAAKTATEALQLMRQLGWIDDPTGAALAFKFMGETFTEAELAAMMENSP